MSNVQGRDPLKSKRSFITDDNSLHDLRLRDTIFLMKIILTKEIKQSLKLFEDVFQFFQLAGESHQDRMNNPANLSKFKWEELKD